jgi:hypothetical protein
LCLHKISMNSTAFKALIVILKTKALLHRSSPSF